MITVFTSLLIAAISGLAYLAVKHPTIYEKLYSKFYSAIGLVFFLLIFWSGSLQFAVAMLTPFIIPDKLVEARSLIDAMTVPLSWLLFSNFGSVGYLFFLSWLARQIHQDNRSKKDSS
jgi:hypothetical protein